MRRAARTWALGLSLGLPMGLPMGLPAGAQPATPAPSLPAIGPAQVLAAVMPMEAAGFTRRGIVDFAREADEPGLGAAAEYRPPEGPGVATVYRYDRGRPGLPDGAAGPAVEQELQSALAEIRAVADVRRYSVAQIADMPPVIGPEGQPALRCLALLLVYEGGRQVDSDVCAGVVRGRFLKLRVTLPVGAAPDQAGANQQRVLEFGRAITAAAERG